jgi:hypothetical protein
LSEISEPAFTAFAVDYAAAPFTMRSAAACRQLITLAPARQTATSATTTVERETRRHKLKRYSRPAIVVLTPFSYGAEILPQSVIGLAASHFRDDLSTD